MSTSKSKLAAYHHGDLRDALIAAALAILDEGGDPAALTLREAARRAGVSAMAPYRHFADKDALLAAVAAIGFDRLGEALLKEDRSDSPGDALVGQGVAYVRFACENPSLFRLMFGATLANCDGPHLPAAERSYAIMVSRVAAVKHPAETSDWALHCWAIAHGLASLAVDGKLPLRDGTASELAERVLRLRDL